jgi:hypothetical protein
VKLVRFETEKQLDTGLCKVVSALEHLNWRSFFASFRFRSGAVPKAGGRNFPFLCGNLETLMISEGK